jgi:glycosyltransferase involved in cell wall biosynthesis
MVRADAPAITIGIPFFNAQATLLDAVRSVFAQTHCNWELILIDDGSQDHSLELARSIKDPRVRVYSDGENRGLAARLNQIVQLGRYEFIARMDADDLMVPDRLKRQICFLLENPHIDLVSSGVVSLSDDFEPQATRCVLDNHKLTPRSLLNCWTGIVHPAVLARRSWYLRNPYNENLRLCEDGELWGRAYAQNDLNIHIMTAALLYYREDSSATVHKLLPAYRIQRQIIIHQWRSYNLSDRIVAWTTSAIKSLIVKGLAATGQMHVLRRRRNIMPLSSSTAVALKEEIASIRNTLLPGSRANKRQIKSIQLR